MFATHLARIPAVRAPARSKDACRPSRPRGRLPWFDREQAASGLRRRGWEGAVLYLRTAPFLGLDPFIIFAQYSAECDGFCIQRQQVPSWRAKGSGGQKECQTDGTSEDRGFLRRVRGRLPLLTCSPFQRIYAYSSMTEINQTHPRSWNSVMNRSSHSDPRPATVRTGRAKCRDDFTFSDIRFHP